MQMICDEMSSKIIKSEDDSRLFYSLPCADINVFQVPGEFSNVALSGNLFLAVLDADSIKSFIKIKTLYWPKIRENRQKIFFCSA